MYGLLNDHIWALFSKVPILVIFYWIDFFFSLNMYSINFSKWATFHMDFTNWLITTLGPLNIDFEHFFHLYGLLGLWFLPFLSHCSLHLPTFSEFCICLGWNLGFGCGLGYWGACHAYLNIFYFFCVGWLTLLCYVCV